MKRRKKDTAASAASQESGGMGESPFLLPPWYEWDEPTVKWLADAAARLDSLSWMMTNAGLAPQELAPLLAMKAVETSRLDGHQIELLDVYKVECLLSVQAKPSASHLLAYNHFRMLQLQPSDQLPDVPGLLDLYTRLMTRLEDPEKIAFRSEKPVDPTPLLPIPPAEQIVDSLEYLTTFLTEAQLPHPLVKLAFAYAHLLTLQPFPAANTAFSHLVTDRLLQTWRYTPLPVLNLARYFRASGTRYNECLKGLGQKEAGCSWLGFFLEGLWHAADDVIEALHLYFRFRENLENQLMVMLGMAVPGGLARFFLEKPAFTRWQFEGRVWLPTEDAGSVLQTLLKTGRVQVTNLPGGEALYYVPDALTFWETLGDGGRCADGDQSEW